MTPKGIAKSLGKALLYFAVYFGWQIIIMNWISIGATYYLMLGANISPEILADSSLYAEYMLEVTEKVYDILMEYALHATFVAGVLTVITFTVFFRARGKRLCSEVGINRQPVGRLIFMVIFGIVLNIAVSAVLSLIPFPQSWVDSYAQSTEVFVDSGWLITLLTTLICAPIVEELTFRGLIFTRLKRGMPTFAAMLISSWIFGVVHGNVIQMLYAVTLGMLICWVRVKYDSLTCTIALHFGFNSVMMLSELMAEVGDKLYYILLINSVLISAAAIIYIVKTASGRVEFTMTGEDENDQTHTSS